MERVGIDILHFQLYARMPLAAQCAKPTGARDLC